MNGQMDRLVYYYCRFFGDGAFCEEHFGNLINYVPPPPLFFFFFFSAESVWVGD